MSFVKVWIHFVWSTKNRQPFMSDEIRPKVFRHIRENAQSKGIYLDFINGYTDHVHCLISLGVDQTLEKIMQLIKGESSFWINKNRYVKQNLHGRMSILLSEFVNRSLKMRENILLTKKCITAQKALMMNLTVF